MTLHPDIKEILLKLTDDALFTLAATVTTGLLRKNKINNRHDAIKAIIKYSPDELSILKRKAVTKDMLFEYLHNKNIVISLPTTKSTLIHKICNSWDLKVAAYKFEESPQVDSSINSVENVNLLGEKFVEWFYNMINTSPVIGPEHFWQDASLTLNLISEFQTVTEKVSDNREEIVRLLATTKETHNLFFNPNITQDGLKTSMDPHGLVAVMVCGTLHTNSECVGVFEQLFSLARDPFSENNWKIKNTKLNLRSKSDVTELPKLCDTLQNDCLSITEC